MSQMGQEVFGMLAAGIIGIVGKIVWDWLSQKRVIKEEEKTHSDCTRIIQLEQAFHSAHLSLAQDVAAMKADIAYIKKKLDMNGSYK